VTTKEIEWLKREERRKPNFPKNGKKMVRNYPPKGTDSKEREKEGGGLPGVQKEGGKPPARKKTRKKGGSWGTFTFEKKTVRPHRLKRKVRGGACKRDTKTDRLKLKKREPRRRGRGT